MNTISVEYRVARKSHQCQGCLSTIPKGHVYECGTFSDGGDIWSFKMCAICSWLSAKRFPDEGFTEGFFKYEHIDIPPDAYTYVIAKYGERVLRNLMKKMMAKP